MLACPAGLGKVSGEGRAGARNRKTHSLNLLSIILDPEPFCAPHPQIEFASIVNDNSFKCYKTELGKKCFENFEHLQARLSYRYSF